MVIDKFFLHISVDITFVGRIFFKFMNAILYFLRYEDKVRDIEWNC